MSWDFLLRGWGERSESGGEGRGDGEEWRERVLVQALHTARIDQPSPAMLVPGRRARVARARQACAGAGGEQKPPGPEEKGGP